MRLPHLVLFAVALGALGCGHPMKQKLEGRWQGVSVENVDDGVVAMATGWARGCSMEFAGSTLTVAIPAEDPRSAKFEIAEVAREREVTLALEGPNGSEKLSLVVDSETSLRWDIGGGRHVVLRREM